MPGPESKHPRPACVEDWDEDTQTTLSSTRATAHAAAVTSAPAGRGARLGQLTYIRDGSDSGYSSKAGTIASTSTNKTGGKKARSLTVDTSLIERHRQPYSMNLQPPPNASRDSQKRPVGAHHAPPSATGERFKHPPTVCWVCDQLGYHPDPIELARFIQPATPASAQPSKKVAKAEQEAQKKLRRQSSTKENRPTVVYAPPPAAVPNFYPVISPYPLSGISTPITPQPQIPYVADNLLYSYAAPVTPITPHYLVEPPPSDYFRPQPPQKDRPPKTHRLSNVYDHPVIHHSQQPHGAMHATNAPFKEARPPTKSLPSSRSVDQQRADREAMPPPGRPKQQSIGRSSSRGPTAYSSDGIDGRYLRALDLSKPKAAKREPSPTREGRAPPSAYKHVEQASGSRPPMRGKSVSYSDPAKTTQVAVSSSADAPYRRRNTTSSHRPVSHDRLAADAEAYIQRKSKLTAEQLTAEKIAEMKTAKQAVSSKSETGSTFSQHSHQSSSKSSSGHDRSRGRPTSILVDGIKVEIPQDYLERKGRPVSMQLAGVNISVGSKDKPTSTDRRDHRLIEKAPSVSSHHSRPRIRDSSRASSKRKERQHSDGESAPNVGNDHGHAERLSRITSSADGSYDYGSFQQQSAEYGMPVYGA
ncbi:hypothetical protein DV735_g3902, partial [Chaetothyriales sp. CBS 134920]